MRFAKRDKQLTWEAKFKSLKSMIGRVSDGTLLVRLAGSDISALRDAALERDGGCVDRHKGRCVGVLQMSHDKARGRGGSDVLENVHMRCLRHHILLDGHGEPMHF